MRSDYYSNRNNGGDNGVLVYSRELDFITSMIESLLHRSKALEKRMSNEIALVSVLMIGNWLYCVSFVI